MPPPAQNPVLIGHDEALRQVEAAYGSGRMHHAWMITGVEGLGKTTLAYHVAHFVLSGGQNPLGKLNVQHPTARLIAAEAHPDLFVLRRPVDEKTGEQKDSIAVEDARKLAPFLRKTATHGSWRVAIIDEAHALNRFGQNAILKVIEEPPARCLILLTVTTPGALLPTIRSRCRLLPLQPLDAGALRAVLERSGAPLGSEAQIARLIELASGSPGFALKILQSDSLPLYEELLGLLQNLPALEMSRLHALADKVGKKAEAESFDVLTQLLRDALRCAIRAVALGQAPDTAFAARLAAQGRLEPMLNLWDSITQTFSTTDHANLDRKLAFINAVGDMRAAV